MIRRLKNWLDSTVVDVLIARAERDNEATADPETDTWVPDLEDRRRLAVSELFILAERQEGVVHPAQYGSVILHNVTDPSEVIPLGEATNATVNRRIARGQLG